MLHPKDFIHPEDEVAIRNLEAIPGFPAAVKAYLKIGYEKLIYGINMASRIRLSPTQLPEIYNRLQPICEKLSIATPEFYLEMDPRPNAYTSGDSKIFIVISSGLLEYLNDDEIDSVIAHECGHIACRHVLYHTMAQMIIKGGDMLGVFGNLLTPIKYAMLYWQRKSELSSDRAAALVVGVNSVVESHIRLSGGPKTITKNINIEEWATQADIYESIRSGGMWDKALQTFAIMGQTHPFSAVRVREILKWSKTEQYERLLNAINHQNSNDKCPKCSIIIAMEWIFCKSCGCKLK